MNTPHPKFFDHLQDMAEHAINTFHFSGKNHVAPSSLAHHEFVHEAHHEHILAMLENLAKEHPHVAQNFANKLMEVCKRVLTSPEHSEHHEHARILHTKVKEIHTQIVQILETRAPFSDLPPGFEEDARSLDHIEATTLVHNIINRLQKGPSEHTELNIGVFMDPKTIPAGSPYIHPAPATTQ